MISTTFMTVREVARMLQLNVLTIYEYIRSKQLLAIKLGRYYRIDEQDLEQFLESHKTKTQ